MLMLAYAFFRLHGLAGWLIYLVWALRVAFFSISLFFWIGSFYSLYLSELDGKERYG